MLSPVLFGSTSSLTPKPLYTPLNSSRNEIRLLQVISSTKRDRSAVECRMIIVSLDHARPYTALSYVWGTPTDQKMVGVINQEVSVTSNLFAALLQIQNDTRVFYLWVDVLCINQQDNTEKRSRKAIQSMKSVSQKAQSLRITSVIQPARGDLNLDQLSWISRNIAFTLTEKGCIGNIRTLLDRPYWTRLWVIQELYLARSAVLVCGSDSIHWNDAQAAFGAIGWLMFFVTTKIDTRKETNAHLTGLYHPLQVKSWKLPLVIWLSALFWKFSSTGVPLSEMIARMCHDISLDATIPHDRVYALLGLMTTEDRDAIMVDYTTSHTVLYAQFTLHVLKTHGSNVLLSCGLANGIAGHGVLPSWTLDWTSTKSRSEKVLRLSANSGNVPPISDFVRAIGYDRVIMRAAVADRAVETVPYSGGTQDLRQALDCVMTRALERNRKLGLSGVSGYQESLLRTLQYSSDSTEEIARLRAYMSWNHASGTSCYHSRDCHMRIQSDTGAQPSVLATTSRESQTTCSCLKRLLWNSSPCTLFVTEKNRIGSGPSITQIGDEICAFRGSPFPFLIRPELAGTISDSWKLVGTTCIDGLISFDDDGDYCMRDFWKSDVQTEEMMLV